MHCRGEYNSLDLLSFPETFSSNLGDSQSIRKEGDLSSGTRVNHRWLESLPQPPSGTEWRRRKRFTRKEKEKESPEKIWLWSLLIEKREEEGFFFKIWWDFDLRERGIRGSQGKLIKAEGDVIHMCSDWWDFFFVPFSWSLKSNSAALPIAEWDFPEIGLRIFLRRIQFKFKSDKW